jgi:hypothetical protein
MSQGCPEREEWFRLVDGEATENRAAELRAHADACPRCAQELAQQRQMVSDLAAPVPVSANGVPAVMRRVRQAEPPVRRSLWRWWAVTAGGLAAAAAAVLLLAPGRPTDPGTFTARGNKVPWTKKVGAEVFVLDPSPRRLEAGGALSPSTPIVASYHNVDTAVAFLMVFARDARGELHWAYPGFDDARADPVAVRLEPQQVRKLLPDSVMLDALPPGPAELITLISRQPLRVSQIEALPAAERQVTRLRARFADARIEGLPLRAVPAAREQP